MRLLFVGSTHLGRICLEALAEVESIEICGVLTAPSRFRISYAPEGVNNILHADFSTSSRAIGCPLFVLEDKMSSEDLLHKVESLSPDCIFVVGWHHMVPKSWLNKWPTFGIHASLLPRYAGGAPLVWAIIEGRRHVGVTLFQFDEGVDSGPIVGQRRIQVKRNDDIATVLKKVETLSVDLAVEEIPQILSVESPRTKQKLRNRKIYPQRSPEDGLITDSMTIKEIRNFVRAQTRPYPGAFVNGAEHKLTVWAVGKTRFNLRAKFGVYHQNDNLYLGRGHRSIEILSFSSVDSSGRTS